MPTSDIEYARSVFTDLVVAWTARTSVPPGLADTEALAKKALEIADTFATARAQTEALREMPKDLVHARAPGSGLTFEAVEKLWMDRAVKRSVGHSRNKAQNRFNRFVLPQLGNKLIADIEPSEIMSVLRYIEDARSWNVAYRVFADIRFLYRYALGAGLVDRDPTSVLVRAVKRPKHQGKRVVMGRDEVGRLLRAMKAYAGAPRSTSKYMLRLAPMVFLRPIELRTLEWRDVDLDAATIVIPASKMKMRFEHVVPLARQAVLLLRLVHCITGTGRFVFTSGLNGDKPLGYVIFSYLLKSLGFGGLVTVHGFRVLAATWLDSQGWPVEIIERQLSHASRRRTYSRAEHLPERRKMMQAWADELERLEYVRGPHRTRTHVTSR